MEPESRTSPFGVSRTFEYRHRPVAERPHQHQDQHVDLLLYRVDTAATGCLASIKLLVGSAKQIFDMVLNACHGCTD